MGCSWNDGENEAALQIFEGFRDEVAKLGIKLQSENQSRLDIFRAMCYLRMGEQENCLAHHNADS